jgi:UDPglucose 6-dehydrogenase
VQIAVLGAGHIGLVTAAGLASLGHRVRVGERDTSRLADLERGEVPFFEPDLDRLVADAVGNGLMSFHASNQTAADGAEIVFVAVPTPEGPSGAADTTVVAAVIGDIGGALRSGALVVLKSTVPMGSVRRFQEILDGAGVSATVVSNPEFLREGSAVADFFNPDRIVIGTRDQAAVERLVDLYRGLNAPLLVTDPVSSEMIKYGANAYLATRVTFANAMANLAEAVGADVRDVLLGMGYDKRIGFHFFSPGPGFGGSCFPKDTLALAAAADEVGYDFALLKGVIAVNQEQLERILAKVREAVAGELAGKTIGLWGLAFKAGTDDTRDSPALALAQALIAEGAAIQAYDPQVSAEFEGVHRVPDPVSAAKDADVLLIGTEWPEFQSVDLGLVRDVMVGSAIVDARNLLDPGAVARLGMSYSGVGR